MAATIDSSLVGNDGLWSQRAYNILDEMSSRGNLVAGCEKAELLQLAAILGQVPPIPSYGDSTADARLQSQDPNCDERINTSDVLTTSQDSGMQLPTGGPGFDWQFAMTTEQLTMIADSLESDGIDWLSFCAPSAADSGIA